MSGENERLAALEANFKTFKERERELEQTVGGLKKEIDDTKDKITKAETWGRAMLYFVLAVGGVLSQIKVIAKWFKGL